MAAALKEATDALKRPASGNDSEPEAKKAKEGEYTGPRWRTRKFAMMMVFSGKDYYGMQRNPGVKSIEEDLLNALNLGGLLHEDYVGDLKMMQFQRASRTDKGVSAAGQIVSLKCWDVPQAAERINNHLPPVIRVLGLKRVTKSFDAKTKCSGRTYTYLMPTFALAPLEEPTVESFRADAKVIAEVRKVLDLYRGTHNYHNFTSGKDAHEESAKRHVISFTCGEPFEADGLEFVQLTVKGQSFMLHQIRKMIGLMIAIVRGYTGIEAVARAQCMHKVDVPKAPGLGLVLDKVHFDAYNKRFGDDGMHESLEWDEYKDEIESFRREHINATIIDTEKKEKSMLQWLTTLTLHHYDVMEEGSAYSQSGLGRAHLNLEKVRRQEKSQHESAPKDDDVGEAAAKDAESNDQSNSESLETNALDRQNEPQKAELTQ